jgi:hypothetical protein
MDLFRAGEQVVIRQGDRGGQWALVVQPQRAEVYKVQLPDGTLLYYSGQQLRRPHEGATAPERPQ